MKRGSAFVVLDMVETAYVVSALAAEYRILKPRVEGRSAIPGLADVLEHQRVLHNRLVRRLKSAGVRIGSEL